MYVAKVVVSCSYGNIQNHRTRTLPITYKFIEVAQGELIIPH